MQEARFLFYVRPVRGISIGKDIASPLSASGAGTERYLPREGRNFTVLLETKS